MSNSKNTSSVSVGCSGIGFILFVMFLVLKLAGVIGWSWWLVTAPLWIPIAFSILSFVLISLLLFVLSLIVILMGGFID